MQTVSYQWVLGKVYLRLKKYIKDNLNEQDLSDIETDINALLKELQQEDFYICVNERDRRITQSIQLHYEVYPQTDLVDTSTVRVKHFI